MTAWLLDVDRDAYRTICPRASVEDALSPYRQAHCREIERRSEGAGQREREKRERERDRE